MLRNDLFKSYPQKTEHPHILLNYLYCSGEYTLSDTFRGIKKNVVIYCTYKLYDVLVFASNKEHSSSSSNQIKYNIYTPHISNRSRVFTIKQLMLK